MFVFSHTCVVKTTHMIVQVIIGNSHTCLVFTTHMEVVEISVNFHTCVVFTKQPEWDPSLNNFHSKLLSYSPFSVFLFLLYLNSLDLCAPKHYYFANFVFGTEMQNLLWHLFVYAQWRKTTQLQPVWLCILSAEQFESAQWRKVEQMQQCHDRFSNAASVTLYLRMQAIRGDIWKCTVEKGQTNVTSVTLHPVRQAI